jgi:hypothetical protein
VRQFVEECARMALLCVGRDEGARYQQDRGCMPLEHRLLKGAHTIAVVMAEIERTQAVKDILVGENEGELGE